MKDNFPAVLSMVLKEEGGFVNHSKDPGGMTNLGCTKATYEAWVGHKVDEATMRALKPSDVAPIYKTKYWNTVRGDDLPPGIDLCVFDAAINSGPFRAAEWLQEVVGAQADGAIGPATLKLVASHPARDVVDAYSARRMAFLRSLETFATFGKGWSNRVQRVRAEANKMA